MTSKEIEINALELLLSLLAAEEDENFDELMQISNSIVDKTCNLTNFKRKWSESNKQKSKKDNKYRLIDVIYSFALDSKAGVLIENNQFSEAKKLLLKAVSICPINSIALLNLAQFEKSNGKVANAIKYFEDILNLENKANIDIISYNSAEVLHDTLELNLKSCFYSTPLQSSISTSLSSLSIIYHQQGRYIEANKILKRLDMDIKVSDKVWTIVNRFAPSKSTNLPIKFFDKVISSKYDDEFKRIFSWGSEFWTQTDYESRGYFSFWYNLNNKPDNIVEEFITDLLQTDAIKSVVPIKDLKGCEWWVHNRKSGQNFGHQLHFDTDEKALEKENKLLHPVYSSVFYISANKVSGKTVVFDLTPNNINKKLSKPESTVAYVCEATEKGGLFFPGNLLHGVLAPVEETATSEHRRITLMIGFWTHNLQKNNRRPMFSAAGTVPKLTRNNRFKSCIQRSNSANSIFDDEILDTSNIRISEVYPAWETIPKAVDNIESFHQIDENINLRFFAKSKKDLIQACIS